MSSIIDGAILWEPSDAWKESTRIAQYMKWLQDTKQVRTRDYNGLWQWSVDHLESFWQSIWDYFGVQSSLPYNHILNDHTMPGTRRFEGAEITWTEYLFRQSRGQDPAVFAYSETRPASVLTWQDMERQTGALVATLRDLGVKPGDRVAGYLPNIPETLIAFLACASVGAVWSTCSPDFGSASAIARFRQIDPKVLLAVDGYRYNGTAHDRRFMLESLQDAMPSLKATILVPYLNPATPAWGQTKGQNLFWQDIMTRSDTWDYTRVPFNHPLWVLYSSGTTGLPKAIVHSQGGILLTQLVMMALHLNLKPGDRAFWFTTTGWVMWNAVVGFLLTGSSIVLYDGSPFYPSPDILWNIAEETSMTYLGTSPAYLGALAKAGLQPGRDHDLSHLVAMGCTGSPLTSELYQWVYEHIKSDIWLGPISGGTDIAAAFVGSCPILPVRAGAMQCRALGVKVESFDEQGHSVVDQVGELVVTEPMPSMPLYLWNDPDGIRYRQSYFETFPGVWHHGDWIQIASDGSAVIYGRSDSTINRQGVRMGSSEIYRAVEALPEITDSLIVDLEYLGRPSFMPLFVVLAPGTELSPELQDKIRYTIRDQVSPRHIPDAIYAIPDVPRTLNGKKLEVPIRKLLMGFPKDKSVDPDAMANPGSLQFFLALAHELKQQNHPI